MKVHYNELVGKLPFLLKLISWLKYARTLMPYLLCLNSEQMLRQQFICRPCFKKNACNLLQPNEIMFLEYILHVCMNGYTSLRCRFFYSELLF